MADRERRRPPVDAGRRVTEHSTGGRAALKIPEGLTLFQPKKAGVYKIEVIPYEVTESSKRFLTNYAKPGQLYFERTYFAHANVGVNNDMVICLAKNFGKPCPVCEHRAILMKSPSKDAEETAYALKPKERQLFLVLDHAEPQKGIQLWDISNWCFGKQLDNKIQAAETDDAPRYRRFADPEEGLTLRVIGSEESMGEGNNKYMKFSVDEFRDRKTAIDPDIFEHGHSLDDIVKELPYDALKKMFLQAGEDDKDEDAPKTAKKPAAKDDEGDGGFAKPKRDRPKPTADDDDDPPAKPARAAKPPADEDDEPKKPTKADKPPPAKGDTVTFVYKDKRWTGQVAKFNEDNGLVDVTCEGRERPFAVDVDDITIVDRAKAKPKPPADDDEPPAKPKKAKPPADDEDEDFDKKAAAKKKPPVDDDDDPPAKPKAKKPAADEDDEPAPKPKAKKPAADDDDEPKKPVKKPAPKDDDWDD